MQINNLVAKINALNQEKLQGKGQNTSDPAQAETRGQDKVELSSQGQALNQVRQAAEQESDVRQEKVEQLKQQVQNGQYNPDSEKTAQAMLQQELDIWL